MDLRFFYHTPSDEPQHTFIALPAQTGSTFGGWGPKF